MKKQKVEEKKRQKRKKKNSSDSDDSSDSSDSDDSDDSDDSSDYSSSYDSDDSDSDSDNEWEFSDWDTVGMVGPTTLEGVRAEYKVRLLVCCTACVECRDLCLCLSLFHVPQRRFGATIHMISLGTKLVDAAFMDASTRKKRQNQTSVCHMQRVPPRACAASDVCE